MLKYLPVTWKVSLTAEVDSTLNISLGIALLRLLYLRWCGIIQLEWMDTLSEISLTDPSNNHIGPPDLGNSQPEQDSQADSLVVAEQPPAD